MVGKIRAVIDTGTMITLSTTCLMNVFREFVRFNGIDLIVSSSVAQESVWKPLSNKHFALNAARIKFVFDKQIVKVIASSQRILQEQKKILALANSIFSTSEGPLVIIQEGEAEALALARIFNVNALFIDERTTRSLIENPFRLKEILERRQDKQVFFDKTKLLEFKELFSSLRVFRSVDLIALAYEQDLFDHELSHGLLELEAALFAAKYSGCAVSEEEIQKYLSSLAK